MYNFSFYTLVVSLDCIDFTGLTTTAGIIFKLAVRLRACPCVTRQDMVSCGCFELVSEHKFFFQIQEVHISTEPLALNSFSRRLKSSKESMAEKWPVLNLNCAAWQHTVSFKYLQLSPDEKNFKHSSESAVQSKQGRSPPPPLQPRRGVCNSVCFHLPWYEASCRPELCVWQWGRSTRKGRPGPVLETWSWTEAICLVSRVSTGRRKGKEGVLMFTQSY